MPSVIQVDKRTDPIVAMDFTFKSVCLRLLRVTQSRITGG
jgi:hypothetical protein